MPSLTGDTCDLPCSCVGICMLGSNVHRLSMAIHNHNNNNNNKSITNSADPPLSMRAFLIHLNVIFIKIFQPLNSSCQIVNQPTPTGLLRINSIPNAIAPKDKDFVLGTQSPLGDLRPTSWDFTGYSLLTILNKHRISGRDIYVYLYRDEFPSV